MWAKAIHFLMLEGHLGSFCAQQVHSTNSYCKEASIPRIYMCGIPADHTLLPPPSFPMVCVMMLVESVQKDIADQRQHPCKPVVLCISQSPQHLFDFIFSFLILLERSESISFKEKCFIHFVSSFYSLKKRKFNNLMFI